MHGLDRVSERSDNSTGTSSAPTSPRALDPWHDKYTYPSSSSSALGVGLSPGSLNKSQSQHGRRMASDAGADEEGSLLIPGITVGSDSVAGLSGRLRLARQPTRTKYGNLPSATVKAMDNQRQCLQAYEYLCHVSEAKEWLVQCLRGHPLSPPSASASPMVGQGQGYGYGTGVRSSASSPNLNMQLGSPTKFGHSPVIPGQTSLGAGDDEDPSGLENKSVVELEEALRNGVALARLARAFMGERAVPRIFTVSLPFPFFPFLSSCLRNPTEGMDDH